MFGVMFPYPPGSNVGGKPLRKRRSKRPLVGYRLWRIINLSSGAALRAVNNEWLWEVDNTAECIRLTTWPSYTPHEEPAPHVECACGLYAQLPSDPLESWVGTVRGKLRASGSILMSGRVIRCARGFKAEHARIQSPVVLEVDCRGGRCDEPVTHLIPGDEWQGVCAEHPENEMVEAEPALREVTRQLESGYPSIEFLTYFLL